MHIVQGVLDIFSQALLERWRTFPVTAQRMGKPIVSRLSMVPPERSRKTCAAVDARLVEVDKLLEVTVKYMNGSVNV